MQRGQEEGLAAERDRRTSWFIRSRVLEVEGCELSVTPSLSCYWDFSFYNENEALCYLYKENNLEDTL